MATVTDTTVIPGEVVNGRSPDHPILRMFLDRRSSRALSDEPVSPTELAMVLEAARWAPSSFNEQPWRFVVARRPSAAWDRAFSWLSAYNQSWCHRAAALILVVSKCTGHDDKPLRTHSFDTGAAWGHLGLQARASGLIAHAMAGFDYARAAADLAIPDGFRVECLIAVGKPGRVEDLPEKLQAREAPSLRKPVSAIAYDGDWERPFGVDQPSPAHE